MICRLVWRIPIFSLQCLLLKMFLRGGFALVCVFVNFAAAQGQNSVANNNPQLAVIQPRLEQTDIMKLPSILDSTDTDLYHKIFALQEAKKWTKADKLIKQVKDKLLLGHVLAQRYLHPTGWRSKFSELKNWLARYADQPDAQRIYKLALRRKPKNAKKPRNPKGRVLLGSGGDGGRDLVYRTRIRKSTQQRRDARNYRINIRNRLRQGWPTGATRILRQDHAKTAFESVERDQLWGQIAQNYLYHSKVEEAYHHAHFSAKRSGHLLPLPNWIAGLAAFRLSRYEQAQAHFEATSNAALAGDWTRAAGAYWASRAALRAGNPNQVSFWLHHAASYSRTFYGIIAMRALRMNFGFNWALPPLLARDVAALKEIPAGRRVLALLQLGWDERAEGELRRIYKKRDPTGQRILLALASRTSMPSLTMRLGHLRRIEQDQLTYAALYPLPHWKPRYGFQVDRALVYALMRQESAFNPRARSPVGAHGLMQVMPATARFVARREGLGNVTMTRMNDPAFNIELGQRYVQHLAGHNGIGHSLFHIIASYNAGPGNVIKWNSKVADFYDPLMFIEILAAKETRDFVERVLANLWMYRMRLEQPIPSLDKIVSGDWPSYIRLDDTNISLSPSVSREFFREKKTRNIISKRASKSWAFSSVPTIPLKRPN